MDAERRLRVATERLAITQEFGLKLRGLRVAAGESPEQFAERCRISPAMLAKTELGRSEPRLSLLLILCERLDLTPGELLSGLPVPRERR